jgi:signal transduction histidine kinase
MAPAVGSVRVLRVPSTEPSRLVGEWLPFAKHIIMGVYNTVRSIEASAQQRDALVALGTLSAGLAHEINNPAAASLRAVDALSTTCDETLGNLSQLATRLISAEQFTELDRLRRELLDLGVTTTDVLGMMHREENITVWLERHHVDQPWELAPALAAVGADGTWLASVEQAVGAEALTPALRWAATTFTAASLLAELADTTNRISNLVGAVKSYTQMDRAERQRFDVHEGLDNTLVMLRPKLAKVRVVREYGTLPMLDGFPAEMNQVWTNLIDNAIDAMDGEGRLRIVTKVDGGHVVVSIADTGPGMPANVLARAFEPFFTTKDVGKGTGLGLDISRRIVVERHKGEITFESSSDGTTAIVRLPVGG